MADESHALAGTSLRQFCTFEVAGRLFGVDILDVKEINAETDFTPVFHAPPDVKGYVNIRGQIHLVLNLRRMLGFAGDEASCSESRRLVIFKPAVGEAFAVLVDRIGDILTVDQAGIEDVESDALGDAKIGDGAQTHLMLGVYKLPDRLLVILDARRFLPTLVS